MMSTCRCEGEYLPDRRFAIIGHRAKSNGKLNINDLAGSGGRMDVLVRAINSALFLSHGIRKDTHITLHMMGGEGPPRRMWFDGAKVWGLHPDERAIAGQIAKVIAEPCPARGHWVEHQPGIWHSGGDLSVTLNEWSKEGVEMVKLDAEASGFSEHYDTSIPNRIGFFLSDDQPFNDEENRLLEKYTNSFSLGKKWVQGHTAIGVVHHLLDSIIDQQ
jgi:tRNA (pseudouridine54-N1)-methyltransferase